MMRLFALLAAAALLSLACYADVNELGQETYDIDSSWAIQSNTLAQTFGESKQKLYDDYLQGCREAIEANHSGYCGDEGRLNMNIHQPMSMRNYTRLGFHKIKAPPEIYSLIREFWGKNNESQEIEWSHVNVYHNMWDVPPTICNVQEEKFEGGGYELKMKIWDKVLEVLEEWTGKYLAHCSIWGVRSYHNGSILAPHVDRNPLISSAIINVAQDIDEDWPLEVWGHDGKPYNISMEPGDMVLYESHSVIHGRPFPLRGNYFANIFGTSCVLVD